MDKDQELLAWAASKLQKEQQAKTFGTVTFYFEDGVITRSKLEQTEKPPSKRK